MSSLDETLNRALVRTQLRNLVIQYGMVAKGLSAITIGVAVGGLTKFVIYLLRLPVFPVTSIAGASSPTGDVAFVALMTGVTASVAFLLMDMPGRIGRSE